MILWILLAVVVVVAGYFIAAYNGFIRLRTQAEEAWADIDVQLKRRYDLIPNLVNAVKGYMGHEQGVLTAVTEARTKAMGAQSPADHATTENALTGTLKSLFAVAEQYPDLKANTNFLQLQQELSDTENKLQAARRFYNGTVRDLNTGIQSFPGSLIAGIAHITKREFFELADQTEAAVPAVKF